MRIETKFVQVPNNPQVINAINNLAAVWGWNVQNIQVTDSKITYEGDTHGWVTNYGIHLEKEIITKHTNYASITYQRDIDHPNYAHLSACEQAYNECDITSFLSEDEFKKMNKAAAGIEAHNKRLKWSFILWLISMIPLAFGVQYANYCYMFFMLSCIYHWISKGIGPIYRKRKATFEHLDARDEYLRNQAKQEIVNKAISG